MNTAYKVIMVILVMLIFAELCCVEEDLGNATQSVAIDNSVLVKFDPANLNDGLDLAYNPDTGEVKVVKVKK